ncbi:MAG: cyclic nucleotide-binding domain-containing protein [Anaerolineales bacterium]|nr:MAG: cyclic nucleotide-binding domain-containing protein [Anaerolineales bacterium]
MIDQDIPKYAALLKEHYLFKGLEESQIAHVVNRLVRVELDSGEVVITEGDIGESFYLVFRGKVEETRRERGETRHLDFLTEGDFFGEETLLFDRPRVATITAVEPTILLSLDRDDFYELLQNYPQIRKNLSVTAESRQLADKEQFDWVGEDELIYLITRKHEFFLIIALTLPIILGLGSIPVLLFGLTLDPSLFATGVKVVGIVGLVIAVFFLVWNWIDWGNDFYIVTNQRVVWLERVLIFYYSRQEAPLTQVLAVNVSSSWLGRIIGYGNVEVRTFTGGILMRNMSSPQQFANFIDDFQLRAQHQLEDVEKRNRERAIRLRLGLEKEEGKPSPETTARPQVVKKEKKPTQIGGWREKLQTFLQVRYEREGVITYRKHWFLLVGKTWQAATVFMFLAGMMTVFIVSGTRNADFTLAGPAEALLGVALFGAFLWWIYNYLDWSNDIYQLTPDQILDIERKPLGREDKKTAPLDSILSIEHTRDGIIQLMFNYGNVTINVGQTKFIFRGVYNPDQVHHDISDYIEVRRRKKRDSEARRDRQKMSEWFGTYHEQTDILEEYESESDFDLFPG